MRCTLMHYGGVKQLFMDFFPLILGELYRRVFVSTIKFSLDSSLFTLVAATIDRNEHKEDNEKEVLVIISQHLKLSAF